MDKPIAYNVTKAAEQAGVSVDVIRQAIKNGDLIARYPTSRPVIQRSELEEWLDTRPTEPKVAQQ